MNGQGLHIYGEALAHAAYNVTVDGGEYNDDTGGVRPNLSQDAVQEFQINRSNYTAELGSASGASINNVVGVIAPPFDLHGSGALSPSQPLGFTSAFPKRQLQFGLRLSF